MKKYKVIWYSGGLSLDPPKQEYILNEIIVDGESIDKINYIQVLSENERNKFKVEIEYCCRIIWSSGELKDAKNFVCDYGNYSKFIYVEMI